MRMQNIDCRKEHLLYLTLVRDSDLVRALGSVSVSELDCLTAVGALAQSEAALPPAIGVPKVCLRLWKKSFVRLVENIGFYRGSALWKDPDNEHPPFSRTPSFLNLIAMKKAQ
jgi:hypothetical protein